MPSLSCVWLSVSHLSIRAGLLSTPVHCTDSPVSSGQPQHRSSRQTLRSVGGPQQRGVEQVPERLQGGYRVERFVQQQTVRLKEKLNIGPPLTSANKQQELQQHKRNLNLLPAPFYTPLPLHPLAYRPVMLKARNHSRLPSHH